LIADAVGLGKTIQAGLIIRQLSVERESFRALVVTPAGLREQWARELATRFGVHSEIVTSAWLARAVREVPADVGPWALPGIYLCSFEYLRRPEVLRPLEEVVWDLVVVDEAHAATPGSARRTAVHAVALRSRRVVLLTATPHLGDDEQFRSLCRIGRADECPEPLLIFRRSRSDAGTALRRRSVLLPVRLCEPELRMHRLLERYTECVCTESRASGNGYARLAAIVLRKRALSSAGSLAISCRRRLMLLGARPDAPPEDQLLLPLDQEDAVDDAEPDVMILGARGLADAAREHRWLEAIVEAADDAAAHESKIALLLRLIGRVKEPIIVFTEFRDTLARLHAALGVAGRDICTIHGGMTAGERSAAQERFNRAGSLLLATDAAAEGLNLHSRCRTVVHFELPWSPSRVEQRTGRVDRIGQSGIVHEIMLVAADTAERLVLAPLAKRAARAHRTVTGGMALLEALSESRVAAAVMEGTPIEAAAATVDTDINQPPAALHEDARLETARLQDLRRWNAGTGRRRSGVTRVSATLVRTKRRMLPRGLLRIYRLALTSTNGTTVHSELVAVHEATAVGRPLSVESLRHFTRTASADTSVARRLLQTLLKEHVAEVIRLCTQTSSALAERERVVSLPSGSASQRLVQGGLFDRRAVRAARERERAEAAIRADADQRIEDLDAQSRLTPSLTLTALAWVEDRGHR
jgi:superfamily II DNA or RNA helicase